MFFWSKLSKLHKKRPNFACGNYIFPKTRGNKNKPWTHSTPLNITCVKGWWKFCTEVWISNGVAQFLLLLLFYLTQKAPPLVARYVPFVAVASANCVNIPMMRQQEMLNGITVYNEQGEELGKSKVSIEVKGQELCIIVLCEYTYDEAAGNADWNHSVQWVEWRIRKVRG